MEEPEKNLSFPALNRTKAAPYNLFSDSGSIASKFAIVNTDVRVRVPQNGLKANLELFALTNTQ